MDLTTLDTSAITDFSQTLIAFLPVLGKALVVLFGGLFLANVLAKLSSRLAERIGLKLLLDRTGLSEGLDRAQITQPPAELLAVIIRRIVQFGAVMYALDTLGFTAAMDLLAQVYSFLPNLVAGLIALVAGAMVAQFAGQLISAGAASAGVEFHAQLGRLARMLLMVITVIFAISQVGFDTSLLKDAFVQELGWITFGIALAFGLGSHYFVRDVLAGYYANQRFQSGDRIQLDEIEGVLAGIGPMNAEIETDQGRVIVPNHRLSAATVRIISST